MKKPKKIDAENIYNLPLYNVHNISGSIRRYNPDIYRGSTLYDAPVEVLELLKKAGITTVIDLAGYGDLYKDKIEKQGLEYVDFNMSYIRDNNASDGELRKNKLIKFIKTMQNEYVYLGCEYGTYKTDAAILLNTLFNPKVKGYCKIYSPEMIDDIPKVANTLYHLMTQEDKKSIGWTLEFEKLFKEKIY